MKLIPRSKARWSVAKDSTSSALPYAPDMLIHPSPSRETWKSVVPNLRYSISALQLVNTPTGRSGSYSQVIGPWRVVVDSFRTMTSLDHLDRSVYAPAMFDTIVRNGTVVTPQGAGVWDVGIVGEQVAAIAASGTLSTESANLLDATGKIVVPGGIDPHTHLAH